ncbi:hypothetical protein niasHT_027484 [Heterodera trifolii]|uniref:Uncharacterized protein n=1 Tax=Heterodera trifolii TaxID=157864 RepID=A0ABD2JMM3_9BILA
MNEDGLTPFDQIPELRELRDCFIKSLHTQIDMWNKLEKAQLNAAENCRDLAVKREAEEHLMKMEECDNCKAPAESGRKRSGQPISTFFAARSNWRRRLARADYEPKGRNDRFPDKKHVEAELLRRDGTIRAEGTVNRSDYANDGKRGERHEISWPDLDPIQHHADNIHRAEFVAHESGKRKVPTEEGFVGSLLSDEFYLGVNYTPRFGATFDANVQTQAMAALGQAHGDPNVQQA